MQEEYGDQESTMRDFSGGWIELSLNLRPTCTNPIEFLGLKISTKKNDLLVLIFRKKPTITEEMEKRKRSSNDFKTDISSIVKVGPTASSHF